MAQSIGTLLDKIHSNLDSCNLLRARLKQVSARVTLHYKSLLTFHLSTVEQLQFFLDASFQFMHRVNEMALELADTREQIPKFDEEALSEKLTEHCLCIECELEKTAECIEAYEDRCIDGMRQVNESLEEIHDFRQDGTADENEIIEAYQGPEERSTASTTGKHVRLCLNGRIVRLGPSDESIPSDRGSEHEVGEMNPSELAASQHGLQFTSGAVPPD